MLNKIVQDLDDLCRTVVTNLIVNRLGIVVVVQRTPLMIVNTEVCDAYVQCAFQTGGCECSLKSHKFRVQRGKERKGSQSRRVSSLNLAQLHPIAYLDHWLLADHVVLKTMTVIPTADIRCVRQSACMHLQVYVNKRWMS